MKYNLPLVSVIVPNFNHEKFLSQRLDSVFNQTYSNFEVILLDDCSIDNSQEILLRYAKNERTTHCVFNKINSGNTFRQWAKGIALAKGELIWIAESDDFCDTFFLEELVNLFENNQDTALVFCQSNRVNEFGQVTGNWITHTNNLDEILFQNNFVMDGNEFIRDFLIYKNVIPNASGVIFRKKNAVQIEEIDFDPVLKTSGDWLFYVKLLVNSKVAYYCQSLNNFRYHSGSVISKSLKMEDRVSIIDVELKTRKKIIKYLIGSKAEKLSIISTRNLEITRELKYEKGILFFGNDKKIKGILILSTVLGIFIKKYKLLQKIKKKILKILK